MSKLTEIDMNRIKNCAELLTQYCHVLARNSGWWDGGDPNTDTSNPLHFSNKLVLIHSEISEAMEADRKNAPDDKLPHREGREVELADAMIRILDLAGGYDMDLAGAIAEKLQYNAQRADHKPKNRAKEGGKKY